MIEIVARFNNDLNIQKRENSRNLIVEKQYFYKN